MVRLVLILAGTLALSQASIDYDRAGRLRQVFSRGHHPSTRPFDPNLTPRCYSTCMPPHTSWTTPLQQRDEAPRSSVSGNTATPFWYLCRSARRPMNKSPQPFCSWVVELVCGTTPDSASLGAPADRGSILGSGRDRTQSTMIELVVCARSSREGTIHKLDHQQYETFLVARMMALEQLRSRDTAFPPLLPFVLRHPRVAAPRPFHLYRGRGRHSIAPSVGAFARERAASALATSSSCLLSLRVTIVDSRSSYLAIAASNCIEEHG